MKAFVVDASVAIKWFVLEEHSFDARLLLDENFELFAPHSQEAHERGLGGMDLAVVDRANADRSDGKTAMAFGG